MSVQPFWKSLAFSDDRFAIDHSEAIERIYYLINDLVFAGAITPRMTIFCDDRTFDDIDNSEAIGDPKVRGSCT